MSHRILAVSLACLAAAPFAMAQQMLGTIAGNVVDATGSAVEAAKVSIRNVDTNLEVRTVSQSGGSFQASNLPIGNYTVTFGKEGFKTETHTSIPVQGDRTTTVTGRLDVGAVATTVEVSGTPLLNQTDTTTGYVLDSDAINNSPLGTGSFTQLAIFSPGLNADFLNGSGSNAGLETRPSGPTDSAIPATAFPSTDRAPTICSTANPPAACRPAVSP